MTHSIAQTMQRSPKRLQLLWKCFTKNVEMDFHNSVRREYASVSALKLPDNYQDINASEVGQFSPLRSREISGSVINNNDEVINNNKMHGIDITVDNDPHVEPYDCRGAVSLSSSMQSNVPSPFGGQGSILGMPGSQWGQGYKYLSDYLHHSHYLSLRNSYRGLHSVPITKGIIHHSYHTICTPCNTTNNIVESLPLYSCINKTKIDVISNRYSSTQQDSSDKNNTENSKDSKQLTKTEQLKRTVAEYGSTVIVFHVTISLLSLGGFYLLVSSGVDMVSVMQYIGIDAFVSEKVTANASTFVLAYAVHKVFAPVRIGITLTATPFIVKYLRRIGVLKSPKRS